MSDEVLSSLQNSRVKQLVKLRDARERRKHGLTRIDGGRELRRALQAGLVPSTVFVCESRLRDEAETAAEQAREAGTPIQLVTEAVYEKIRYGERDEGLCAEIAWSPLDLAGLDPPTPEFVLVVEGVEKPGNLGALLRTADAAGVGAVILADPACEPANPNVIRASMGTLFTLPLAVSNATETRAWLKHRRLPTLITRPEASSIYTEIDMSSKLAVVMGAEHAGLTPGWDDPEFGALIVRLPMAGFSDSLNLAAATAVLLYEAVRQRSI